ncbi:MAG TPA: hypothetical protein VOA80_06995 [Thermoanaerobaculia bacterium]|nr:hypothetical protein [Thermoanaerobaculia bacterium]
MIAGPSEIRFRSPQEKYELYNFFRQATLDRLVEMLLSPEPQPVVLLSGEEGSGRGYLLEAAVYRSRRAADALLLQLDLAGYEEGDEGLVRFLNHQVSRLRELSEKARRERGEQVRSLLHGIEKSFPAAVLISLLLRLEEPLQALRALFPPTFDDLPGPRRDPRDSLRLLLEHLSSERRLVLHVEASSPLDDVTREQLLRAARRNPRMVLVFSCHPRDDSDRVAPRAHARERLELAPLTSSELRSAIELAFAPCDFPDELYDALVRFSRGRPARLAVKMYDLVRHEILLTDPAGVWRLGESGIASELAAAQLAPAFLNLHIPVEGDHPFQSKATTDSDRRRPLIPI